MIDVRWQATSDPDFTPAPILSMRSVATAVAEKHGLTLGDLKSQSRERYIAWPRQEAMAEVYKLGRFSLPQIGMFFGGRDHTTVLHGVRAHQKRLDGMSA